MIDLPEDFVGIVEPLPGLGGRLGKDPPLQEHVVARVELGQRLRLSARVCRNGDGQEHHESVQNRIPDEIGDHPERPVNFRPRFGASEFREGLEKMNLFQLLRHQDRRGLARPGDLISVSETGQKLVQTGFASLDLGDQQREGDLESVGVEVQLEVLRRADPLHPLGHHRHVGLEEGSGQRRAERSRDHGLDHLGSEGHRPVGRVDEVELLLQPLLLLLGEESRGALELPPAGTGASMACGWLREMELIISKGFIEKKTTLKIRLVNFFQHKVIFIERGFKIGRKIGIF